jgi:putative ABC transport system substrate-binding protein
MKRREFITLLGGAAAGWPVTARGQQPGGMRRIGLMMGSAETDSEAQQRVKVFQRALDGLGWIDGRNVRIEYRWTAGNPDRTQAYAAELLGMRPDLIVAHSTPVVKALQQLTRAIPIVFVSVSDPIGDGIAASLPEPGGNITGFTNIEGPISSKWLEILKEIAPHVTRVGFMYNPKTAPGRGSYFLSPFESAASLFHVNPVICPVNDAAEIESTVTALGREPNSGLVVSNDIFTVRHRELIISLASLHRVPAVFPFRFFATEGGLVAYGTDLADLFRRSATYVDRILKGENPGHLPIQAPIKFELVINLKTAKALGLTAPPTLLVRADEVIE